MAAGRPEWFIRTARLKRFPRAIPGSTVTTDINPSQKSNGRLTAGLFEHGGVVVDPDENVPPEQFCTTRLEELAGRIRDAHRAAVTAGANALANALAAGDALLEARDRVSEGWKRWVEVSCGFAYSTAKLYMRLARRRGEIEAKLEAAPDLSVRGARLLITNKSVTKKAVAAPAETIDTAAPVPSENHGPAEVPLDPITGWASFSDDDKRAILDHEGRRGLAKILSPKLVADLVDHLLGQEMFGASTEPKPAVTLTAILRVVLDPSTTVVNRDIAIERFKAKLEGFGLDLHAVSIALKGKGRGRARR